MDFEWSGYLSLNRENVNSIIASTPGVYKLAFWNGESWTPFYVGQSDDLSVRMGQYLILDTDNDCIKNHIRRYSCGFNLAKVVGQANRDVAERTLYDHYSANFDLCNDPDCIPDVQPVHVNAWN
ncbi:MAG: hypothetical protein ACOX6N_02890 [Patescibacteria group bacterium]